MLRAQNDNDLLMRFRLDRQSCRGLVKFVGNISFLRDSQLPCSHVTGRARLVPLSYSPAALSRVQASLLSLSCDGGEFLQP